MKIGKALSCKTRVDILKMCCHVPAFLGTIAAKLGMKQSTISEHINILEAADLVEVKLIPGKRRAYKSIKAKTDEIVIQILGDEDGQAIVPCVQE